MCMLHELGLCPQAPTLHGTHGSAPTTPANQDESSSREGFNGTILSLELESPSCKNSDSKGHQDGGKDVDDFADLKV
jgi:hypothetical protein